MELSARQKRYLRSLCHHLRPVVIVGGAGATSGVLGEVETALAHHELIKIRIAAGDRDTRRRLVNDICLATGAELVQTIGHVATFYRRGAKPRIVMPQ